MILLDGHEIHVCCKCERQRRPGEPFCGPRMWHYHSWTCGHPTTYECPECYKVPPAAKCPQCGCMEEKT